MLVGVVVGVLVSAYWWVYWWACLSACSVGVLVGVSVMSSADTVVPALFVAFGTPEVKSTELLSVSIIAPVRALAVVFVSSGAASVSTVGGRAVADQILDVWRGRAAYATAD